MNYQSQQINAKMSLEEAINSFQGEICYLTLKDGTIIEIVQNKEPEMGFTDNQLSPQNEYDNEFIEEDMQLKDNNFYYQHQIFNQQGVLRGRGQNKKLGKSLRKTVLKSLDGKEKEKKISEKGKKLKNVNEQIIVQQTETNDFLQCANCFKFFPIDEEEKEKNELKIPQIPNKQQLPSQPKKNELKIPQMQNKQQLPYQLQNNQFYPQNQQPKQAKHVNPQQPRQVHQVQKVQQNIPKQQNYQQITPQKQKIVSNQRQKMNIPQGNLRGNQPPMQMQFRAQPKFRARKKVSNRYDSNNDRYFNTKNNNTYANNNFNNEGDYYYPASGKKQIKEYKICDECSSKKKMVQNASYGNINFARKLNFGFNQDIQERGYNNGNFSEFIMDETEYYEYPPGYQRKNIPSSSGYINYNNNKIVTLKSRRNQYQDYDYY